jgi:uncharacterized membrane protein
MNVRAILAALAGAVVMFLLGYVVFGVALHSWYDQQMAAAHSLLNLPMPILWALFLAQLMFTLLLALVYDRYATITTPAGGALAGLWMGFLVFMSYDLSSFAFFKFVTLQFAVIDGLLNTVIAAVAGGVIGLVLGMGKK